ncbi:hypothetical protein [Fundicoccus culcitae]|uniref:Glycosyltransferase RgtA/B/C/D-like domain-containing protein n=1 Tax=Fundicoccus culcitae TaxID=2969821 RepID=A0ABY5P929_9LACT|nr:hypothetical protein [Fundicoccus culcitae]UUX35256.1 hypothetical protein NRE15_06325 [Fundicoccus culcitae]
MSIKQDRYLLVLYITLLAGFLITTAFYYLSLMTGSEGIALDLFGGGIDGIFYWEQALNVANDRPWVNTSIYPWLIGQVVKLTNIEDVFVIRMFNYLGYIVLVFFSTKLMDKLIQIDNLNQLLTNYKYEMKTIVAIILLIYPSLLMNAHSSIIRDVWIYALYVIATYLSLKIFFAKENILGSTLLLLPTLWLLWEFRNYIFLSFVLTMAAYFFYRKVLIKGNFRRLILWAIILFGIYYTFFRTLRIPFVNMSLVDALQYRVVDEYETAGGSQMWINLNQSNFLLFILNYIYSYIGNMIGPLPWQISGVSTLIIFVVEAIPMTLILFYIYRKRKLLTASTQFVLLHGFVWFGMIAITNDNVGTATRLRVSGWLMIVFVFIIVWFKSLCLKKEEKDHVQNIIY